jgi:hypothetical protein
MKFSQIKPFISLAMYSTSVISCIYYWMYNSCAIFKIFIPLMGAYFTIDLFIEPSIQYKIHHLACIYIFVYGYTTQAKIEDAAPLLYYIVMMEISSLFLVSRYWIKESSYLFYVNKAMFYLTFAKFRIHDVYYGVLHHTSELYPLIDNNTPNSISGNLLIACLYVLYGMNVYWFIYMNSKMYDMFMKNAWFNSEIVCEHISSYTCYLGIPICMVTYMSNYTLPYLYETLGVSFLAITSYYYHYDKYLSLKSGKDNINYTLMLVDNVAVNTRVFSSVYVNYYNNPNSHIVFSVSGFGHLSSILLVAYTMYRNSQNKYPTKTRFYQVIYSLCFYPLFIDTVFNCANSTREYYNPVLLVNWFIICVFIAEPFDKLNHIAFHILLNKNTYYQCLMNIHNNRQ